MFRSSTIIREIALNLAKLIFTLKHSVKFYLSFRSCDSCRRLPERYLLCGFVAACCSTYTYIRMHGATIKKIQQLCLIFAYSGMARLESTGKYLPTFRTIDLPLSSGSSSPTREEKNEFPC